MKVNDVRLVVAVDPAGMYHVARTKTVPARHRRGRTLPGGVGLTGFCVRSETAVLAAPAEVVDLADRGADSPWCPECAGYLDHLDNARTAEVDQLDRVFAAVEVKGYAGGLDDFAAQLAERNAASMAQLGEQLTGVPAAQLLADDMVSSGVLEPSADDELAARRELRRLAAGDE